MNVAVITVTYNPCLIKLEEQIRSITHMKELIIVDNGSSNIENIKILQRKFNFKLLALGANYGIAKAQNVGLSHAISLGAEHALLLDQDSVLEKDFLINIYNVYKDFDCDILGPVFFDSLSKVEYKGSKYIGPFIKREPVGKLEDVTFIIASGSFFSLDVFSLVGGMEESLFIDYVDVDWSLRAKAKGYKVQMTNRAKMSHDIGDSRTKLFGREISIHSPIRRYYLIRNSFFMIRKSYVPLGYKIREVIFNVLRFFVSLTFSQNKKSVLKYSFRGVKDGLSGKFGPYSNEK